MNAFPLNCVDGTSSGRSSSVVVRFQVPHVTATLSIALTSRNILYCGPVTPYHHRWPSSFKTVRWIMRFASLYGYGFTRSPYMTLKTAVVAPMPKVSDKIAVRARPGLLDNSRQE